MSQADLAVTPPAPNAWHMYRAMVGVGLLCGAIIVSVFQGTKPIIERNREEALRAAVFEVLPAARSSVTFRAEGEGFVPVEGPAPPGASLVHAGYGEGGELVGLAIEAAGMGYQDVIRVLWGWSFEESAVVGMRVLESKETPGLGDKIMTDDAFRANFAALDVSLAPGGEALAHPVVAVKHGEKENPWEVDGITGATISSVAIADLLRASASEWVPRLTRSLDSFRREGP